MNRSVSPVPRECLALTCAASPSSCGLCSRGTWSNPGSMSCTPCIDGKYSSNVGATSDSACKACNAGFSTNATTGRISVRNCTKCEYGKWASNGSACKLWTVCPYGSYANFIGNASHDRQCAPHYTMATFSLPGNQIYPYGKELVVRLINTTTGCLSTTLWRHYARPTCHRTRGTLLQGAEHNFVLHEKKRFRVQPCSLDDDVNHILS